MWGPEFDPQHQHKHTHILWNAEHITILILEVTQNPKAELWIVYKYCIYFNTNITNSLTYHKAFQAPVEDLLSWSTS
jgi:hypothetical protein